MSIPSTAVRDIELTTLSNGVKVITEAMAGVRSVAIGLWIGTGSRNELPVENGVSHFIEHMLFKGSETRSAEDIARQVDSIGGHLDAFTGKELVGFNIKVIDEHVPEAFDILADMLLHPKFSEEDIEKEKGVILEELKMDKDNPESQVHEIFVANFWKRHPLGRPIIGTKKTIASFHRNGLRAYHERNYVPHNLTITAAGHLKHEELLALAEKYFGGMAPGAAARAVGQPATHAPLELKNKRSLHQVHFCLGVPCHPTPHPLRFACYTLNVILGAGMSSRLFQNIRERQGLAYAIFSELNLYRDSGCLGIYGGTSVESARRVVSCIVEELRRMRNEAAPADELRRAKDHLKGSLMLSLESTSARMGNLARQSMYFGRFFTLDELNESIESVTAEEVQAVAREFFTSENAGLVVLGRLEGLSIERSDLEIP